MKNYFILAAHLDDIEFGLTTYLKKNIQPDDKIFIYVASAGFYKHSSSVNYKRNQAQIKNLKNIFLFLDDYTQLHIHTEDKAWDTLFYENKKEIRNLMENWIVKNINPNEENILITLAPDIHEDHRIISELCDVIARPNLINFEDSLFNSYYKFYIPGNYILSTKYNLGSINQPFKKKTILELKKEEIVYKINLLKEYPSPIIKLNNLVVNQEIIIKIF